MGGSSNGNLGSGGGQAQPWGQGGGYPGSLAGQMGGFRAPGGQQSPYGNAAQYGRNGAFGGQMGGMQRSGGGGYGMPQMGGSQGSGLFDRQTGRQWGNNPMDAISNPAPGSLVRGPQGGQMWGGNSYGQHLAAGRPVHAGPYTGGGPYMPTVNNGPSGAASMAAGGNLPSWANSHNARYAAGTLPSTPWQPPAAAVAGASGIAPFDYGALHQRGLNSMPTPSVPSPMPAEMQATFAGTPQRMEEGVERTGGIPAATVHHLAQTMLPQQPAAQPFPVPGYQSPLAGVTAPPGTMGGQSNLPPAPPAQPYAIPGYSSPLSGITPPPGTMGGQSNLPMSPVPATPYPVPGYTNPLSQMAPPAPSPWGQPAPPPGLPFSQSTLDILQKMGWR